MCDHLIIRCPYCDTENRLDLAQENWKDQVNEVLAVPLAARIGHLSSEQSASWREIASLRGGLKSDLIGVWNRTVGILRYPGKGTHIYSRELRCASSSCHAPFDVYLSASPGKVLENVWPHLTGKLDQQGNYSAWPVRRGFEKFLELFHLPIWAEGLLMILIFSLLAGLTFLPQWELRRASPALIQDAILKVISSFLIGLMLVGLRAMGKSLRDSRKSLLELIRVANLNAFSFWHNFMLARFSGADPRAVRSKSPKSQKRRMPLLITQADVLGGIPSVLFLLLIWSFVYFPAAQASPGTLILELIFWVLVAYFTGTTGWISLNFSVFMTENISLLPMKLTPLNGYSNIKPVRKIIISSLSAFIPIALLPLFFIGAEFVLPTQSLILSRLLMPWFFLTFGLALLILGFADRTMAKFAVAYVIIFSAIMLLPADFSILTTDRSMQIISGLFWTALLAYQVHRAFTPVQQVLKNDQDEFIHTLDMQLLDLTNRINLNTAQDASARQDLLLNTERIIKLREIAAKAKTSIINLPAILGIVSPVFSSLVIPLLLDLVNRTILDFFQP